jgi:hypothetical protein
MLSNNLGFKGDPIFAGSVQMQKHLAHATSGADDAENRR